MLGREKLRGEERENGMKPRMTRMNGINTTDGEMTAAEKAPAGPRV